MSTSRSLTVSRLADGRPLLRPLAISSIGETSRRAPAGRGTVNGRGAAELVSIDRAHRPFLKPTTPDVTTMTTAEFAHLPVLADEVIAETSELPAGFFADLTLGGAGHAQRILDGHVGLSLHGFDRDPRAIDAATAALSRFGERATVHRARFDSAPSILRSAGVQELSGFLMDLGVSSPQLDEAHRGFSFRLDGPLDMRMDTSQGLTAADVVNTYGVGELRDVLESYGDERHASRIVHAIVDHRPVTTTQQLAEIVENAVPAAVRRKATTHVATRTFQALRIEINDELSILGDTLSELIDLLAPDGIGLVLTYHSGEDKIVKDRMRRAVSGDGPPGLPVVSSFEWGFRGAVTASETEIESNPRARSARFRAIARTAQ